MRNRPKVALDAQQILGNSRDLGERLDGPERVVRTRRVFSKEILDQKRRERLGLGECWAEVEQLIVSEIDFVEIDQLWVGRS